MHEEIVKLAQAVSGAGETEGVLLELLCDAAEQAWTCLLYTSDAADE